MQVNEYRFFFDKQLAESIAANYQHLIGKTFPITIGVSTIEVPIDRVVAQQIEKDAYDVFLFSYMNNIDFREIYMVINLSHYRLLNYLELKGERFPFEQYGIGYTQLLPVGNDNGNDKNK